MEFRGTPTPDAAPGRKETLTEQEKDNLVKFVKTDKRTRRRGIHKRKPRRKFGFRRNSKARRLAFAEEHKNWGYEEWSRIVWCDEKNLTTAGFGHRPPVLQDANESEHEDCLEEEWKCGRKTIMGWASFCGSLKSPLIILPDITTSLLTPQYIQQRC